MNVKYRNLLIVVVPVMVIIVVVYLLLHQSLFHSFNCASENASIHYRASNNISVDSQIIVTGPGIDDEETRQFLEVQLGLIPIEKCYLSYLNWRKDPNPNLTKEQRESLSTRLYEVPDNQSVSDVIVAINGDTRFYLLADRNYRISSSSLTSDSCGQPYSGGGSGGGPFGEPGIPSPENDISQEFMHQWAFVGSPGINLPSSFARSGKNVRVGVFDTSPYRNTHPFSQSISIALPSSLELTSIDALETGSIMSNHGLFVAGLIHAIAPDSEIQLIRVLDDNGCGQLWVLIKALQNFTSEMSKLSTDLDKVVINMSLTVHSEKPYETQQDEDPVDCSKLLKKNIHDNSQSYSLKASIDQAYCLGAVIVAAAGNDNLKEDENGNPVDPWPQQFPAEYNSVIGVASSNNIGERSCFSNVGDVAAPGGDGKEEVNADGKLTCTEMASTCDGSIDCQYGLISLAQTDNGPQYVYWSGTSFSAPLVSGLAALIYEDAERDQVRCLIEGGAAYFLDGDDTTSLGAGIINVTDSLSNRIAGSCGIEITSSP